jgi:4-amino-4-deoxy-L-arabinose transferase-like glycosyltransferase
LPGIALATVVAAVMFLYPLALASRIPLLDPDEGLHARIAQEMVERGDWVVPRLLGKPFLDKPILYFWCEALSLGLLGMSEAALRLPGLLLGLAGAVTTAAMAWRMFDRQTGLVAGLCYATTILPAALAQAAAHDVALVPWVTLSLLLFWEADRQAASRQHLPSPSGRGAGGEGEGLPLLPPVCRLPPWLLTALAGLVLGLAILTKGLAGVALVGIAYGGYLLATRRLRWVHCLRGALALAVAAGVAAGWYLAVEHRCPGYLHYYFVERHLLGFATGTQPHGSARWWYYLPMLLGGGLPWIAYVPVALGDAWRQRRSGAAKQVGDCPNFRSTKMGPGTPRVPLEARPLMLLASWLIGCTVFLSLSHSKLVTYIWPVFPAAAILAAVAWSRLIDGRLSQAARRWMGAVVWGSCLSGPIVLPALLFVVQHRMAVRFSGPAWTIAILTGLAASMPLGYWVAGRARATFAWAALGMAAQFAVALTIALPPVAHERSARDLAVYCNRLGRLPARLFVVEERVGSLVFYLDHDLRSDLREEQIVSLPLDPGQPLPVFTPGDLLAIPDRALAGALPLLGLAAAPYQQAGHYRIYPASGALPRRPSS